jgi:hypothetical protein
VGETVMWTASARRSTRETARGGEDTGDGVRGEDRRDGLEPAQAAIRAGAHVDVVDPAEKVGSARGSPGSACPRHDCRTQRGADTAASAGRADAPAPRPGLRWADLLRRVYDIDMRTCPNCGQGRLEPIATILDPDAIARILAAMALQPRAPPG